jgi:hypothetical protein
MLVDFLHPVDRNPHFFHPGVDLGGYQTVVLHVSLSYVDLFAVDICASGYCIAWDNSGVFPLVIVGGVVLTKSQGNEQE